MFSQGINTLAFTCIFMQVTFLLKAILKQVLTNLFFFFLQIKNDEKATSFLSKSKEPFNFKLLERKALTVCGLGNRNRLYFYKHLCSITVNWDGKDFRRRVSIQIYKNCIFEKDGGRQSVLNKTFLRRCLLHSQNSITNF